MTTPRQFRRGFTLIEFAIALIIVGIIGAAFTKLLTSQSRFFDQQTNIRKARSVARNSMNVMLSDLRMVQDSGGIDSAASDGKLIRIKVPYRFGLVCATNGTITTVSMLPSDSSVVAMAKYGGFAWRDTLTGRYRSSPRPLRSRPTHRWPARFPRAAPGPASVRRPCERFP